MNSGFGLHFACLFARSALEIAYFWTPGLGPWGARVLRRVSRGRAATSPRARCRNATNPAQRGRAATSPRAFCRNATHPAHAFLIARRTPDSNLLPNLLPASPRCREFAMRDGTHCPGEASDTAAFGCCVIAKKKCSKRVVKKINSLKSGVRFVRYVMPCSCHRSRQGQRGLERCTPRRWWRVAAQRVPPLVAPQIVPPLGHPLQCVNSPQPQLCYICLPTFGWLHAVHHGPPS